jgi:glutamyl-tRNA synthetase
MIRTRIAPSPTGFLHLGTARTALFSWAFARHHGGKFVLRIEDTDVARSSQESVDQILAAMTWLGIDYDEGPIYQMDRLDRYKAVAEQLVEQGKAYRCYATPEELDGMRQAQKDRHEKTRYDGRWRPEPGKQLPNPPDGIAPVIRFKNPIDGNVIWTDLVKGEICINNREIDDLIIVRADGVPTYNFAVVIDDWDMQISHVFRGDEHINNTPWQINLYNALQAPLPAFGHIPVILGDDGQKLSKRRGAVSVTEYAEKGFMPAAMLNYLARLGWSHGDDEIFDRQQLFNWFDGSHLAKSPAQWDPAKLEWVNAQYIKASSDDILAEMVRPRLEARGFVVPNTASLTEMCRLFKDRCATLEVLVDWLAMYFVPVEASDDEKSQHLTPSALEACEQLSQALNDVEWTPAGIAAAIKSVLLSRGLKMPQLAVPVRVMVCGRTQTPSIDSVLALFDKKFVLQRLQST